MSYIPNPDRYKEMEYRRCGNSGLKLPAISLGLWQNFGNANNFENCRNIVHTAFDNGITHFDLANNYGPPPGAAEEIFGNIYREDLKPYRDELIISSKAGWKFWEDPYGNWGSKKYLIASLNQSLLKLGLDYVDIFYHHRPDPETPLEETMSALDLIVKQGKALYIGISNYPPDLSAKAFTLLKELGTPCLIHQPKYNLLTREVEAGLLDLLEKEKVGCITYSSLAQGLLTDKYLNEVPPDSRIARHLDNGAITNSALNPEKIEKIKQLNHLAHERNQTLAQMAVSWVLRDDRITSVILGASQPQQVINTIGALKNYQFSGEELNAIDSILAR